MIFVTWWKFFEGRLEYCEWKPIKKITLDLFINAFNKTNKKETFNPSIHD